MVPMECREPKNFKVLLIDIKKYVEINPSRSLEEVIQLTIQGLSTKHYATDGYHRGSSLLCNHGTNHQTNESM